MGVVVSVSDKLDSKAQSWRILFRKTLLENETAFVTVTEPETLIATAQSIDVADALAGASIAGSVGSKLAASAEDDGVLRRHFGKYIGSPEGREEKSLVLVWVPSDAVDSKNIEALVNSKWEVEGRIRSGHAFGPEFPRAEFSGPTTAPSYSLPPGNQRTRSMRSSGLRSPRGRRFRLKSKWPIFGCTSTPTSRSFTP